jgi:hypothetical protein
MHFNCRNILHNKAIVQVVDVAVAIVSYIALWSCVSMNVFLVVKLRLVMQQLLEKTIQKRQVTE